MSTKFTPGPWFATEEFGTGDVLVYHAIRAGKNMWDETIASTWAAPNAANANLIAAAPMLYEAMDRILNAETATQYGVDNDNRSARYKELAMALQDGRAALKAARGES